MKKEKSIFIHYLSKDYPFLTMIQTKEKNVKEVCKGIVNEGGEVINVFYNLYTGKEILNIELIWENM